MVRIILMALLLSLVVQAQKTDTPYRSMAPLDQYLIADRNAEIAMARSAAPKSIADNAGVMVLERQGYKTAVPGTNGFLCMVERSWTAGFDDPAFWNPKIRGPICSIHRPCEHTSHHHRENPAGLGGQIGNPDAASDQLRSGQEGAACARSRYDVLHAVEARLLGRSGRTLASTFDVLGRTNRTQILGRRDARLSRDRRRGDSWPVDYIHDPSRPVVRRHLGFSRSKVTIDHIADESCASRKLRA